MITGITGQDGSYLAELLLEKGYSVVGLKRRTSLINTERINHLYDHKRFKLEYFDLNDSSCMWRLLNKHKPWEVYNLAAQSHVRVSFDVSESTVEGIVMGTLRLLNAVRDIVPEAKVYQASSSEMYGDNPFAHEPKILHEHSLFMPASPYACAKLFAHNLVNNYRKAYDLHVSSGILFNHESPRRGETFVTRKITMAAARIKLGLQDKLFLGNLDAKRDWGFAGDYVKAMWLMLQQQNPDDYVIATGKTYTVKQFLDCVFEYAGLGNSERYVEIDPRLFRPQEVPYLCGDNKKAKKILGWVPEVDFEGLAKIMYDNDFEIQKRSL